MANVIKHKRGSGSDPTASDLVVGEVAIRTDVGKLFTKMDNGSVAEIAGGGSDIAINTLSSSSGTGGGSATFNGSAYRFTLSAPPSVSAQQLLVSINGVIQKPVAGTGQPSEGFSVDGTDIILGDAPATGSDFFILTFKSLGVSEPADNSVTSAKIVDGAIVNADVNASAAIAGSKIDPTFTSTVNVTNTLPEIFLTDSNSSNARARINANGGGLLLGADNDNAHANSSISFEVDGSNAMFIKDGGNVGIGTTSPSGGKLHIAHGNELGLFTSGPYNFQAKFESTDAEAAIVIEDNGSTNDGNRIGVISDVMAFTTANSERMRIDSSGNVHINGTPPWSVTGGSYRNLSISGEGASASGFLWLGNGSATTNADFDLARINFNNGATLTSSIRASTQTSANDDGRLTFFTKATGGSLSERMRIDSAGDVVIGSSTNGGSNRLYVVDSHTDAFVNPTDSILRIENANTSGTTGQASISFTSKTSGSNADSAIVSQAEDASGNCRLEFWTDTSNGMSEKMVIDSSGKVAIGTNTSNTSSNSPLTIKSSGSSATRFNLVNSGSSSVESTQIFSQNNELAFTASGSEKLRILNGGGITFNGDTAAANALDDYEEGTFTPTSNATLTSAHGSYTKIGRQVTVHIRVKFASQSSSTAVVIGSLPFSANMPSDLSNGAVPSGFGYISGSVINGGVQIHMQRNAAQMNFYVFGSAVSISTFSNRELRYGLVYHT